VTLTPTLRLSKVPLGRVDQWRWRWSITGSRKTMRRHRNARKLTSLGISTTSLSISSPRHSHWGSTWQSFLRASHPSDHLTSSRLMQAFWHVPSQQSHTSNYRQYTVRTHSISTPQFQPKKLTKPQSGLSQIRCEARTSLGA
jgi:hypothetical protein